MARPAGAQVTCGDRDLIVAALWNSHGEVPVSRGLASDGVMIEVLAAESGTFTVLLTRTTGASCMITSGDYWENLPVDPMLAKTDGSEPL